MTAVPERLREAMEARDVDQQGLAAAVGCTQGAISQILLGTTRRSRFLPEIARALSVDLDWLEGREDAPPAALQPPAVQYFSLRVALPSEAVLAEMFRSILVLVPEGASREETAAILARRLPAGLQALQPAAFGPAGGRPPAPARDPARGGKGHGRG